MAIHNLTRKKDFSKTTCKRYARATIDYSDLADGAAADDFKLYNIPGNCIITRQYTAVIEAAQATAVADFGTTAGGTELDAAVDLATVAVTDSGALAIHTGTGVTVYMEPNTVLPSQGKFVVITEFIEYEASDGKLLNFSA